MGLLVSSSRPLPLRPLALLAAATAAALLVTVAPPAASDGRTPALLGNAWTSAALDPALPVSGSDVQRVVVSGATGALDAVRRAVELVGGTLRQPLPIIDGVSATVPADRLVELSRRPGVTAVTADRKAALHSGSWDETVSASSYAWTSGATEAWQRGARGHGVGVAVLDTGVAPVNDLAGRIVHGPDLSGEGDVDRDSYGHGTVMAGIVAGSGADSGAAPRTGIAPGAHVVSVKVAGANGATDVSTVLAAMHWVAAFQDTYGIRVLNLSWGVPSTQDPTVDPLNHAVQRLWGQGITVVVAAGNDGPRGATVTKPGDDPLVVTVGAYDDRGDTNLNNDRVPQWSSHGPTAQGLAKPDLVAPGRTLVAARSPGSTVEHENPEALVDGSYIKGSGSSQAAAAVSGAAALLLSARPELSPDQVKAALTSTASPLRGTKPHAQGAGRLQVDEALAADLSAVEPQTPTATGTGSLDASRGDMARVAVECDGVLKTLDDETTSWCTPWDGAAWTGAAWTGAAWTGAAWTGAAWTDADWTGAAWTGAAWTGAAWTGAAWTGAAWTGAAWTGAAWTGAAWTGAAWTGAAWTGAAWTGAAWTGAAWTNAFWGDKTKPGRPLPGEDSES